MSQCLALTCLESDDYSVNSLGSLKFTLFAIDTFDTLSVLLMSKIDERITAFLHCY